ncbi:MAG: hypothetical protein KBB72_03915 [Candidatus Kapabacteria bacterium]|nr:hypothetical protein [Candidatus Kapabacteria bacterium]
MKAYQTVHLRRVNCSIALVMLIVAGLVLDVNGQTGNLSEVLRFNGSKDKSFSGVSILRANQDGVAVSLTRLGGDGSGGFRYYPNHVVAITNRGIDTINFGSKRIPQSVVWGDSLYSAIQLSIDTVYVATSLVDHGKRFSVDSGGKRRYGVSINSVDGSMCLYDTHDKITVWKEKWGSLSNKKNVPELEDIEMFSLRGDVFLLSANTNYMIPFESYTPENIRSNGSQADSYQPSINVTVLDDSVVWIDKSMHRWSVSLKTGQVSASPITSNRLTLGGFCAGRYGYFALCSYECNIKVDSQGYWDSLVVQYQGGDNSIYHDTIRVSKMTRWGAGVGWWNGAFYFTIEKVDSASPANWDSTTTIIYKYTEPIPVVSVEDQLSTRTYSQLAERLAFTQDAYASWRDGLGADVTAYDLLGNEVRGFVVPRPGVYCVRGLGKVWLVSVTP